MQVAINSDVRTAVFHAWGHVCAYCKVNPAEHVDHIFPRARGGKDHLENYAASCARCNLMKTDEVLGEGFLEIMRLKAKKKAPKIAADIASKRSKRSASNNPTGTKRGTPLRKQEKTIRVIDIPWDPEVMRAFLTLDSECGEKSYSGTRKFTVDPSNDNFDTRLLDLPCPTCIGHYFGKSFIHESTHLLDSDTLTVTYADDLIEAISYAMALRTQAFIFIMPDLREKATVLPSLEDCMPVSGKIDRKRRWLLEIPNSDSHLSNYKEAA